MVESKKVFSTKECEEITNFVENRIRCLWIVWKLISARIRIIKIIYANIILKWDRLTCIGCQKFWNF
jgi:hypothetical protein